MSLRALHPSPRVLTAVDAAEAAKCKVEARHALVRILTEHYQLTLGGCRCGHARDHGPWSEHIADVYEQALEAVPQ